MRADEFINETQKLDEVLPLIVGTAALGLVGGAAAGVGAGIGSVARGAGAIAKGAGQAVGAVGNLAAKGINKAVGTQKPQKLDPKQMQDINRAKDQLIRPGKKIILPTQGPGGPQAFKVSKVQGDEVELVNPEGNKSPNQPNKLVYKKADVKSTINI